MASRKRSKPYKAWEVDPTAVVPRQTRERWEKSAKAASDHDNSLVRADDQEQLAGGAIDTCVGATDTQGIGLSSDRLQGSAEAAQISDTTQVRNELDGVVDLVSRSQTLSRPDRGSLIN